VDRHLGDQLLVPASLVAAGVIPPPPGVVPTTRFTVREVTKHLTTNADVVRRFLPVSIEVSGREGEEGEVQVRPANVEALIVPIHRQ
jgi:RNA 3'-terminal phosphate cyclase (ATP)